MKDEPTMPPAGGPETGHRVKRAPHSPVVRLIFAGTALAGGLLLSSCNNSSGVQAVPKEDAAYASQVELTGQHLSAEENFLGQQVVYLDGKITNDGPKIVRQVKIRLFFRDTVNQVVLREDDELLGNQQAPLGPGQTRDFQIRFDRIPDSWNRQVPQQQLISLQTQ